MSDLVLERIVENLARLRLTRAQHLVATMAEEAQSRNESYLTFLDRLLQEEVSAKEERRLLTALKVAGLPVTKTIEAYEFSFHEQLDKRAVMSLFDLDFIGRKENVIFLGPPGVGKTHLAIALAMKACVSGLSIYFTTMAALIEKLKRDAASSLKVPGAARVALVVVDEVGYMPISRQEAHLFFQFISWRYERASTVITSNKSFTEWEELFGDAVIASAMLEVPVAPLPGDQHQRQQLPDEGLSGAPARRLRGASRMDPRVLEPLREPPAILKGAQLSQHQP
jgi:DNA replication protein DnaC